MKHIFEQLRHQYPWPDVTGYSAHDFTLGGGGRELIERELMALSQQKGGAPLYMLEVGCFMCASTRRWLQKFDNLYIVGVDPWPDSLKEQVLKYVDRPLLNRLYPHEKDQQQFVEDVRTQGPMETGLANLKGFEDRFIPVKAYAPDAFTPLAEAGFIPDLVYIDGAKQIEDLEEASRLWPTAKITGDDWHWGRTYGYPMRKIVKKFASNHGFGIEANWATWVLHKDMDTSLIIQAAHKSDLHKLTLLVPDQDAESVKSYYQENLSRTLVAYDGKKLVGAGTLKGGKIDLIRIAQQTTVKAVETVLTDALERIVAATEHKS